MADTKVSALTAATSLTGNETLPIAQSGSSKSATPELLAKAIIHPGYVAGKWYAPMLGVQSGTAMAADTVKVIPFFVPQRITVSDLAIRITTVSAGGHVRVGIYASDATTKKPTGNALSSAVIATDSALLISATLGANVSLNPGLYYLASQSDNSTVVCNAPSSSSPPSLAAYLGDTSLGNLSTGSSINYSSLSASGTYASGLPDLTSATLSVNTTQAAYVWFKVTSVP